MKQETDQITQESRQLVPDITKINLWRGSHRSRAIILGRSLGSAAILFVARAVSVIYQLRFANQMFGVGYGGLIALLNQMTFYILLAELGLAAATTALLFEPVHRGDTLKVGALLRALQIDVRRIVLFLLPFSLALSILLTFLLRRQIAQPTLFFSLLLTCASALITFMALPYQSHFNASDRVPLRNVILGFGFALKVAIGVLLAKWVHSFIGLPLGTTLVGVGELLLQRRLVEGAVGQTSTIAKDLVDIAQRAIREKAKFVIAHRIGYLFIYQSDYIILLFSSSLALLGYYAQYQYIYAGLLSFSIAVGGTLTARIAKRQINLGQSRFAPLYRRTSMAITFGALLWGTGFYCFADFAVRILYKSGHVDHRAVTLFSVLLMLNIVKINDDLWIDTTGSYETGYYLPILEAATYLGLGLLLVRHWHIVGILYAGIATNLAYSVILKGFVIGRGVMRSEVLSTMLVKFFNLFWMGIVFYLLTEALGVSRFAP